MQSLKVMSQKECLKEGWIFCIDNRRLKEEIESGRFSTNT